MHIIFEPFVAMLVDNRVELWMFLVSWVLFTGRMVNKKRCEKLLQWETIFDALFDTPGRRSEAISAFLFTPQGVSSRDLCFVICDLWSSCDLCFPFFGSDVVGHLRWIMIDVRYCNFHSFANPRKALVCECWFPIRSLNQ